MGVAYFLLLCSLGLAVTAQDCPRPVPGPNMRLTDSDSALTAFPDGTKVTFTCNLGYQVEGGSRSITCTAGAWNPVSLVCGLKSCPSLGDLTNGQVNYHEDGPVFGTDAEFTCNPGYNLVGSNKITCGDKGWMDRMPVCEVQTCDQPPAVVDGSFSPVKDTYDYLEVIRYSCIKDYIVNGAETTSCSENGTFTPQPPTCVKVECRELNVPNGVWSSGSRPPYGYKATVTYKCETGYKMEGSPTATCGINSQWSQLPTCKLVSCNTPEVKDAEKVGESSPPYTYKETVTFKCKGDLTMEGKPTVTCEKEGQWKPALPTCSDADKPKPWKIILIVISVLAVIIIIGVVCYWRGIPPFKKRNRGSTRGYPINDATNHGEEVALS